MPVAEAKSEAGSYSIRRPPRVGRFRRPGGGLGDELAVALRLDLGVAHTKRHKRLVGMHHAPVGERPLGPDDRAR